ncbi:carboxy terminal-processing peptidase [Hymenobacter guriensis]|nr:carboxy terminal-processing peptidase [Hymenobacter guriensis]
MLQGLTQAHYQPEKIDDNFSKRVFDLALKRVDYNKMFLLQTDVARLRKYQTSIDDQVRAGTHEFLDVTSQLIEQRTREAQTLYRDILSKPFDFTVEESVETDSDKLTFPVDKAAQREQWRKYLKYETMLRMSEMMDAQTKKDPKATTPEPVRTPAEMEAEARKRVLKNYDDKFSDILQTDANDRFALYANAIANTYDPHTEYFAPRDKADFDLSMTGRFEGIGATLKEQEGQIRVDDILPGSASYRQGELKKGDVIMRVAQGAAEPVSVEGWRLDKAISLIRGKKGSEVRLTVKKPDASIKVIPIIRDVVILEETYAQSAVINDNGKKIGYLRLPIFYADFNDDGGRSSAADVRKELEKLKKENVDGVIFDLRYNGGGSLPDAVDMTGLFIDSGPVVQVKGSQGSATVLNDRDPRVQYSGPLVVLVNKHSASASEILAAAIQDYKRGVIMGSASTYGKGTVQRIVDLDDVLSEFGSLKPFGSLKLTMQKFYRINGGSTQFKGVVPDIILPDALSYLDQGEKEQEYALKWDEIGPARYKTWAASSVPLDKLKAQSQARIAASPSYKLVSEMVQRMRKRKDDTNLSLKLSTFRLEQEKAKAESDRYEAMKKAAPVLAIAPLATDVQALGSDSVKVNRAARFTKVLKTDIDLREAVAVMKDQL